MNSQLLVQTGMASAAAVIPATALMANSALASAKAVMPPATLARTGKTEYIPMQGMKYLQHLGVVDGPALSGDGYATASYPEGLPIYHDFEERTPFSADRGMDAGGLLVLAPLYLFALGMAGYGIFGFLRGRSKPRAGEGAASAESTPLPVVQDNGPETVAATPRAKAPRFGVKIGGESIPGNSEPPPAGDDRPRFGGRTIF